MLTAPDNTTAITTTATTATTATTYQWLPILPVIKTFVDACPSLTTDDEKTYVFNMYKKVSGTPWTHMLTPDGLINLIKTYQKTGKWPHFLLDNKPMVGKAASDTDVRQHDIALLFATCCHARELLGDEAEGNSRVAGLEKRIANLEAENAQLRKQLDAHNNPLTRPC